MGLASRRPVGGRVSTVGQPKWPGGRGRPGYACTIGIPLGIALYNAIRGATLDPIGLTALTYIATILSALVLYAVIALTPARLLARQPITPQLAYGSTHQPRRPGDPDTSPAAGLRGSRTQDSGARGQRTGTAQQLLYR